MQVDPRIENSTLLDGLSGKAREERAELISWLLDNGETIESIGATASPVLLPARRVIGDDGQRVSLRELAESTGLDMEFQERMMRAMGLPHALDPDAKAYLRADGETTAIVRFYLDSGYDPDELVRITRVLSEALTAVAEQMRNASLGLIMHPGATELDIAQRGRQTMQAAEPTLGPMITGLVMLKLRHSLEIEAVTEAERAQGARPGAREIAVAFADLVDFTRFGEARSPEDVEQIALRLADLVREVIEPPVRLVKTIGDAVMLVSPDPEALLHVLMEFVERAEAEPELPQLRVGMAWGPAVGRSGDWFGSPVNLASRVTAVARPGSVLVAETLRDRLAHLQDYAWTYVGHRKLKGIRGETRLHRVRRQGVGGGDVAAPERTA
ncbi:adenylate/guanylate cyclase domain-containing protein [Mycolicibacterium brumae]|uniref:adenylate/guanylate cyclase domain-containing protein n=1 Tax=Mycolicibacterium brumae TaxID=85968 RepID=UPI000A9AEF00|nr:adenylate/guanylate cyclase domain-containing protein [Mycolicibacterium brumae]